MKPFGWTLISALVLSVIAEPIPEDLQLFTKRRITTRDSITEAEVDKLGFYAQYASSSYCNAYAKAIGSVIACPNTGCVDVTALGVTVYSTFANDLTDQQGLFAIDDTNELIVVSFKGTVTVRNWITDFVFAQVPCDLTPGCLVHTGFLTAYEMVKDQVVDSLAEAVASYPTYTIIFVGHSMGGAVATYAAADFRKNLGYDIELYTYASPRVGNYDFAKYVTEQAGVQYRVTHLDDIVPRIPPMLFNYRHLSPEYWIDTGAANATNVTVDSITICDGYSSTDCNAGQTALDIVAHDYYFLWIDGCGSGGIQIKRDQSKPRDLGDMSDDALEAVLTSYSAMDQTFAQFALGSNVWS